MTPKMCTLSGGITFKKLTLTSPKAAEKELSILTVSPMLPKWKSWHLSGRSLSRWILSGIIVVKYGAKWCWVPLVSTSKSTCACPFDAEDYGCRFLSLIFPLSLCHCQWVFFFFASHLPLPVLTPLFFLLAVLYKPRVYNGNSWG